MIKNGNKQEQNNSKELLLDIQESLLNISTNINDIKKENKEIILNIINY